MDRRSEGGSTGLGYCHIRLDIATLGQREPSTSATTIRFANSIKSPCYSEPFSELSSRHDQIPPDASKNVTINCKGTATSEGSFQPLLVAKPATWVHQALIFCHMLKTPYGDERLLGYAIDCSRSSQSALLQFPQHLLAGKRSN